MNLGGAPFHLPVRERVAPQDTPSTAREGAHRKESSRSSERLTWVAGARQPAWSIDLLLGPGEAIPLKGADLRLQVPEETGWRTKPVWPGGMPGISWSLMPRFATIKDLDREDGASGPREALLRPLEQVLDERGVPVGCLIQEVDRLRGEGAGGRWILLSASAWPDAATIRSLVERATEGAAEFRIRPETACLEAGETPRVRLVLFRPGAGDGPASGTTARIRLLNQDGKVLSQADVRLGGTASFRTAEASLPLQGPVAPGLYRIEARLEGAAFHPDVATTGVWIRDGAMLGGGPTLTVSRDWIRRDGAVFPIVGTTYMDSSVHRKFLFEPDPAAWDRDFASMEAAGIRFVRTGLWTAWSRLMLDPGAPDENALRALDAYVLSAARHGIVVCFTFFAFQPPAFGGSNPFLDPRAREGQRALMTLVASRYRGSGWVHWDLINEPSYAPASQLWNNLPVGDKYERQVWEDWVARNVSPDPLTRMELWQDASQDPDHLPGSEELGWAGTRGGRRPEKSRTFALFSQEVLSGWASWGKGILREASGGNLVTLGQDEGGIGTRPSPQFHGLSVDYTCVHTWWLNDDLLFDTVVTKIPERPHLVQETGMMRLDGPDGMPWRSEEESAALLERKLALAFAGRACGAVEWVWNTNPYQPLDNEAAIGLHRVDGTAREERKVLSDLAAFANQAAPFLDDWDPDPVLVILPHARLFSGKPLGLDAPRRIIRVLSERFGVVPAAVSDHGLTAERLFGARLVWVPVPEILSETTRKLLEEAARKGVKIVVTGEQGGAVKPLSYRELWREGQFVTFPDTRTQYLRKADLPLGPPAGGEVWRIPLPIEFAAEEEPLAQSLGTALVWAGIPVQPAGSPVLLRVLNGPRADLVVAVNESSIPLTRSVRAGGGTLEVEVRPGRARLLLLEKLTGKVLAEYPAHCGAGSTIHR